jgi:excisionase family DNA binding protein
VTAPLTYTVAETAELLGISRGLAYELARTNRLPHLRLGGRIVIPRPAVERLLAAATPPGTGPWDQTASG